MAATFCGAKNRQGGPCKNGPVPGKHRCRFHGGYSTGAKGKQPLATHGIYGKALTDEEKELWGHVKAGSVDDEIKLLKLQLLRALMLAKLIDAAPDDMSNTAGFVLSEIKRVGAVIVKDAKTGVQTPTGGTLDVIRKRPDLPKIIVRLVGQITRSELARREILGEAGSAGADEGARKIREALAEMEKATRATPPT